MMNVEVAGQPANNTFSATNVSCDLCVVNSLHCLTGPACHHPGHTVDGTIQATPWCEIPTGTVERFNGINDIPTKLATYEIID